MAERSLRPYNMILALVIIGPKPWYEEYADYLFWGLILLLFCAWLAWVVYDICDKWAASQSGARRRRPQGFEVVRSTAPRPKASRFTSSPTDPIPLDDPGAPSPPRD